MKNFTQFNIRFYKDVDMIGHYAPGDKSVFFRIKFKQGILNKIGKFRYGKITLAMSGIQPFFNSADPF